MRKVFTVAGILLLIPLYVGMVHALPGIAGGACETGWLTEPAEPGEVGVCTKVSATVHRGYYFDTITLPVYVMGVDLDLLHKTFLPLLLLLSAAVWRR